VKKGIAVDKDKPDNEVAEVIAELDEHAETFASLCELAEGVKGKFDIKRATKIVGELLDELEPASELVMKHLGEFRDVFDGHLKHSCLLRAKLIKEMMDVGITEDHAMKIMESSWTRIVKSAADGIAKAAESRDKKS
jgi:hypothetical protein